MPASNKLSGVPIRLIVDVPIPDLGIELPSGRLFQHAEPWGRDAFRIVVGTGALRFFFVVLRSEVDILRQRTSRVVPSGVPSIEIAPTPAGSPHTVTAQ